MTAGSSTAQHSVLLNYISPILAISFYKSLRHGHIPVALSILGFSLLKLIVIVSTALFADQPTAHAIPSVLNYATAFTASSLWTNIFLLPLDRTSNVPDGTSNVPADIVWAYLDQLSGHAADPNKVKDHMVFQSFPLPAAPEGITSASAVVDVFVPNVTCESAHVAITNNTDGDYTI
jgi:hypothetical protein